MLRTCLGVLLWLSLALPVSAQGWVVLCPCPVCDCCAPCCCCPPCPCPPPACAPRSPAMPYAAPSPAPPSSPRTPPPPPAAPTAPAPPSPEPPVMKPPSATLAPPTPASRQRPAPDESRFYDPYPIATRPGQSPPGAVCLVKFWNLSGQEQVVHAGGRTERVPRGGRIVMQLPREFQWQAEGKPTQRERVEGTHAGLEIVIRR